MCQSRTSLIAVLAIVAVLFLLKLVHWNTKQIFQFSAILLGTYLIAWMFSSSFFKYPIYGNSMFNGVALESQSAMGRLEAWRFLGKMILEKPVFGHGPNKDFFYENRIYSENEYVLYAWRYGIVGLTGFILLFLIPLKKAWKSRKNYTSALLILVVVLLTVTALTNNPFTERTILVFFALILGVFYQNNPVNQKTTL
jgi:O-antigen ligase